MLGIGNVYLKALLVRLQWFQGIELAGQEPRIEEMPFPGLDSRFNYFPLSMQVNEDKIGTLRAKKLAVTSL